MSRAADLARRARPVAGALVRRAGRYSTGLTTRVRRRTSSAPVPGLLSIVVPCYDVEDYLDECLDSLRSQEYRQVEIVVVDDGSPDRCAEMARRHALRDPRVRLVVRENGGLGAARNTGIEHARGEFLTFVDSDDVVTPHSYRLAMESLARTGSDFALLNYDRLENGKLLPAARWIRLAHAEDRPGVNVAEFPEAMVNAVAWSKVYRRSFFDAAGLRFPERVLYEDQAVSAAAFARARAFDVLTAVGVHWRIRIDRSSISQNNHTLENLRGHQEAMRESLRVLTEAGLPEVAAQRRVQLLTNNMGQFARDIARAHDGYWDELRRCVAELYEGADLDGVRHRIDAQDKVLYALITADEHDEAVAFLGRSGHVMPRFRSTMTPEGVRVDLPVEVAAAREVAILSDRQLELRERILGMAFTEDGGLELRGWASIANVDLAENPPTVQVTAVDGGKRVPLQLVPHSEVRANRVWQHRYCDYRPGGFTATLDPAAVAALGDGTRFEVSITVGDLVRTGPLREVSLAGSAQFPHVLVTGSRARRLVHRPGVGLVLRDEPAGGLPVGRSARGVAAEQEWAVMTADGASTSAPQLVRAVAVDLAEDSYTLSLEVAPGARIESVEMTSGPHTVTAVLTGSGSERRAEFPLSRDLWGHVGLGLPTGKYAVRAVDARGVRHPVRPTYAVLSTLPSDAQLSRYRVVHELEQHEGPTMALNLGAPLQDDELGMYGAERARHRSAGLQVEGQGWFFRSLYGEVTNCNALAVHTELVGRGSTEDLVWSVADHSVPVPPGGTGLIEGTEAWYRAMHTSRNHMVNVHQLGWFVRPEGQRLIQTMHGYPYKIMGHAWWAKGPFKHNQVENFDRRAREWTHFVSPASYATPLLEKAFLEPAGAHPEILEIGYPRNDVLLSPDAEGIRRRTRELLGIRPDQKAVMYAPTFRDYLAVDDMEAEMPDLLDVEQTARQLGEEYVLLVRGHAFNARAGLSEVGSSNRRIIDVTTHPEINDLILASDAAVLDYSSLRFDYSLTDKPMVFLVPDVEKYDKFRGGVIPYAPTAPGPQVRTAAEVVALLRDLDALERDHAAARATFRATYADLDDGRATQRLLAAVLGPLDEREEHDEREER